MVDEIEDYQLSLPVLRQKAKDVSKLRLKQRERAMKVLNASEEQLEEHLRGVSKFAVEMHRGRWELRDKVREVQTR
jgi:hypothetical protein